MAYTYRIEANGKTYRVNSEKELTPEEAAKMVGVAVQPPAASEGNNYGDAAKYGLFGGLSSGAEGLASAGNLVENIHPAVLAGKGIDALTGGATDIGGMAQRGIQKVTGMYERGAEALSPETRGYEAPDTLPEKFVAGAAGLVPYVATSPVRGAGVALGALQGAGDQRAQIKEYEERTGLDVSAARELAAQGIGGLIGTAEGALPEFLGGRFLKGLSKNVGTKIIGGVVTEGPTEGLGNLAQDLTTQQLVDPEKKIDYAGAGESALIGGVLGGALGPLAGTPKPDQGTEGAPGGPGYDMGTVTEDELMGGPEQPEKPKGPGTQAYEDEKSKLDGMIHDLKAKIDAAKETNPENAKSAVVKAWQSEMKAAQSKLSEIADLELADQFPDDPSAQRVKAEILLKRQQQKELEANPVPDKLPPGGPKDAKGAKTTDVTGAERQAGPFTGKAGEATVGYNTAEARKMYEESDKTPPVSTEGLDVQAGSPQAPEIVAAKEATTNKAQATGAPLPDVAAEKEMSGTIDISDEYEALSAEAKKDREYNTATQILDGIVGKSKIPEVRVLKESKPVEMEEMVGEQVTMEGDNVQRDTGIDVGEYTAETLAPEGEQIDLSGEMTPTELELGKVEPVTEPLDTTTNKINPFSKKAEGTSQTVPSEGRTDEEMADISGFLGAAGVPGKGNAGTLRSAIERNSMEGVLRALEQSENIFAQRMAKLGRMLDIGSHIRHLTPERAEDIGKQHKMPGSKIAGAYDYATGIVDVKSSMPPSSIEMTTVHELAHPITQMLVDAVSSDKQAPGFTASQLTQTQVDAAKGLIKLYEDLLADAQAGKNDLTGEYGLTNHREFISEAFSNWEFQRKLKNIKYKNTTAWGKFTEMVAKLLGLKNDNAFTEFLSLSEKLTAKQEAEYDARQAKGDEIAKRSKSQTLTSEDRNQISVDVAYAELKHLLNALTSSGNMTTAARDVNLKKARKAKDTLNLGVIKGQIKEAQSQYDSADAQGMSHPVPSSSFITALSVLPPSLNSGKVNDKVRAAMDTVANSYRSFADVLEASPIPALQRLGVGVRNYVDAKGKYEGQVRTRLKPGLEALRTLRRNAYLSGNPANIAKANEQVTLLADFFRHRDWGRTADARAAVAKLGPEARLAAKSIIDSFNYVGKEAVDIGVLMKSNGKVVPFKMRKDYFPRIVSHEYANAMRDPFNSKNAETVNKIADWMVKNGKAKDVLDAKNKMNDYSNGVRRLDDFHGNLERSRNDSMPEFIYDYSVDAAKQYLNLSSERLAQISGLGQTIGAKQTLFDQAMKAGLDNDAKANIIRGAGQIYGHNIETMETISHSPWTNAFNSFVTGSALGSPFASSTNLIGGLGNIAMVLGARKSIYAIAKDLKDYKSLKALGDAIGLTPDDVMNMHDTFSVIESGKGVGNAVGRFMQKHYADKLLTINGFKLAEKWNRIGTLMVARAELQDALLREKNGSRKASQRLFKDRLEREGIDWEKLKAEGGEINGDPNSETAKYYRKLSNLMQGSYQVDQIPLYVNSPVGRLFFKFWKFNTQQLRLIEREFVEPLLQAIDSKDHTKGDVALRVANLINGLAKAGLTGVGISASRLALNPKTELSRVITAANKGDIGEAALAALYALVAGMFAEGTLGLASMLGETAEWAVDNFMEDDISTKGLGMPMVPASAGTVENVALLINDIAGAETAQDYKDAFADFGKKAIRIVRDGPKMADWLEGKIAPDSPDGKAVVAQKNRLDAQKYIQDYMEVNDIKPGMEDERNFWQKVFGLPPTYEVKNKELKKNVREKIEQGDPAGAKALMDEALDKIEDRKKKQYLKDSIKKSLKWYYPLRVDVPATDDATAEEESIRVRDEFIAYMADKYPEETVSRITEAADLYENNVREAGLWLEK